MSGKLDIQNNAVYTDLYSGNCSEHVDKSI